MFKRVGVIKFNSIKFKVGLFYTVILGVILVIYTGILYFGQRYALYQDLDREIMIKAQEVSGAINSFLPVLENDQRAFYSRANDVINGDLIYFDEGNLAELKKRWDLMREKLNIGNDYIVLSTIDGKAIANSYNMEKPLISRFLKSAVSSSQKTVSYQDIDFGVDRLRLVTMPYYYKNSRKYLLQIGSSRIPMMKILYGRLLFASLTIPFILIFASFLGGVITARVLGPVMEVTKTARNITYKDLHARVKADNVGEELRYLIDAFNEMIARLDNSFRHIDEFSSNVAHELKTPLTIISGESELALMQERDAQEYKRVVGVNLKEAGTMLKIVEDLLLLSRLEYEPSNFNFEQLDFNLFIEDVFEQGKKMAGQKNISLKLLGSGKPLIVCADQLRLRRLFLNLLNNAVKFTPSGGNIAIIVEPAAETLKVSVKDTGMGIKPECVDKIFDRFYHIDGSQGGGSGLGLSIAQSIAKIHHGDISVKSRPGLGSTFIVSLPI